MAGEFKKTALDAIEAVQKESKERGYLQGKKVSQRLRGEWDMAILWSMYIGWSHSHTARMLGVAFITARYHRAKFENAPYLIFKYPVMRMAARGRKRVYVCEFCGSAMPVRESMARRHVASHVVSPLAIKLSGVYSPEEKWGGPERQV